MAKYCKSVQRFLGIDGKMIVERKKNALVTGGTKYDVAAFAVLLLSFLDKNPGLIDEFVVFHDGISKKDQQLLNRILPSRFVRYSFPGGISGFPEIIKSYFTTMVFCKYECFRLLRDYRNVIWSDYDVVVAGGLSPLLDENSSGFRVMPDHKLQLKDMFNPLPVQLAETRYELNAPAVATPLFVFSDIMPNQEKYYQWCIEKTCEYADFLYLPEQAVFTMLLQNFDIHYSKIPYFPYCVHPELNKEFCGDAVIFHSWGRPKFWSGLDFPLWLKYYHQWLALGGSPHREMGKVYPLWQTLKRNLKKHLREMLKRFHIGK